ncbi:MAG: SpoIIE family protein phosphatase [Bernardetiaceae bacterium]|nr:SpoIIE family protein phosphatase [Bernardetiaceae bacterium]
MTRESFEILLEQLAVTNKVAIEKDMAELYHLLSENYQQEPERFAETIITWLSCKVGALMGVFWVFDQERESFDFIAGFSCTAESVSKANRPKNSDSLYRAVMKNKEVVFIEQLNTCFHHTATYSIALRSWLVLPLTLNETLLCGIELYHHNNFSPQQLHFLWQAVRPIAAAWAGISEQDKRKILIDKLHHQNEEISTQEEELRQQTEELIAINENLEQITKELAGKNRDLERAKLFIEKKNESIMASIQYAQRIQKAMLPSAEALNTMIGEHVLLFLPRDVVSGDFYWTFQNKQGTWIAAVDCTGHGVPAALMGMMGINVLEHAMSTHEAPSPAEVLTYLNERVQALLRAGETNTKDGMDIALCLLDYDNKLIHYAGAMNSAYYITDKKITRLKHTRRPVGRHVFLKKQEIFTNQTIKMQGKGMLYMCSDGYQDQFGGPENKKFMRRKFLNLLQEIAYMPTNEQTKILELNFDNWKANEEQTDDVLVLGIRL